MKEFVYHSSDVYISKILVNRKRKNNLEIDAVTEVKLYSSSKKIGYNYYQCNLAAIVRISYDNKERFFANIVYTTFVDFYVDPTDLEAEDKIEHILKTVVPKDVLYNQLRNKIYTVTMESGVSSLMISDNYPYEYIDKEEEGKKSLMNFSMIFPAVIVKMILATMMILMTMMILAKTMILKKRINVLKKKQVNTLMNGFLLMQEIQ